MKTGRGVFVLMVWAIAAWDCHAQVNKHWVSQSRSSTAIEENLLFYDLDPLEIVDLRPGDILLKKDYGRYASTSPVIKAQRMYKAEHASRFTSHAMLFVGAHNTAAESNSDIAESITETPSGVVLRGLATHYGPSPKYPVGACILVYRCNHPGAATHAVQTAKRYATDGWPTTAPAIGYSYSSCFGSFVSPRSFLVSTAARNTASVSTRTGPLKKMMCSEFVIFCYQHQLPADARRIQLDAPRTAPIRLEEGLNSNDNFQLLGRLVY